MAANLFWGGQRAAGGIAEPVGTTLPRVLQAAAQARQHFLITLISFPRWSLISKMQAPVMKPALRQGQSKTSLLILLTAAQPPLLACRICWVLVWLPLTHPPQPFHPFLCLIHGAVGEANSSSAAPVATTIFICHQTAIRRNFACLLCYFYFLSFVSADERSALPGDCSNPWHLPAWCPGMCRQEWP